jgi:transposase-like protein
VFLDATYLHVRRTGQVTSMAVVIATGVTATGGREILGVDVGDLETPPPSGAQSTRTPLLAAAEAPHRN